MHFGKIKKNSFFSKNQTRPKNTLDKSRKEQELGIMIPNDLIWADQVDR